MYSPSPIKKRKKEDRQRAPSRKKRRGPKEKKEPTGEQSVCLVKKVNASQQTDGKPDNKRGKLKNCQNHRYQKSHQCRLKNIPKKNTKLKKGE